jgi:hypothetical protein
VVDDQQIAEAPQPVGEGNLAATDRTHFVALPGTNEQTLPGRTAIGATLAETIADDACHRQRKPALQARKLTSSVESATLETTSPGFALGAVCRAWPEGGFLGFGRQSGESGRSTETAVSRREPAYRFLALFTDLLRQFVQHLLARCPFRLPDLLLLDPLLFDLLQSLFWGRISCCKVCSWVSEAWC